MGKHFLEYALDDVPVVSDAVSTVWHATDRNDGQRVTVRLVDVDATRHGAAVAGVLDATAAAASLDDEWVPAVLRSGVHDGRPFVVSRLVGGAPLQHLLGRGIPADRALAWLGPLADVLDHAARQGLPHGAVHPAVVWITADQRPLLTGFGLVPVLRALATDGDRDGLAGAFAYVAPEVLRGGDPTGRTDQYALAGMLYHATTGRPPMGTTLAELYDAHLFVRPREAAPGSAWSAVLDRALSKEPWDRFDSSRAMLEAFAVAVANPAAVGDPVPDQDRHHSHAAAPVVTPLPAPAAIPADDPLVADGSGVSMWAPDTATARPRRHPRPARA